MKSVHSESIFKLNQSNPHSSINTLDVKSKEMSNHVLLCDEWYDIKSDNICYTKSANSPSQTNYSDPDTTPHEYTALSSDTGRERENNINTVHHTNNVYADIDNYGSVGLISTPSISISGLDSIYNPLNSELIDISTIVCDSLNDDCLGTARNAFYVDNQDEFEYARSDLFVFNKDKITNFFKSIASTALMENAEDWGIDRSIYTVYSRPGFFADCHNADQLYHGEYLNHWGMECFAECRMPLIFCIILTDKEVRKNEVQSSIAPLAINLLDRFMSKNKNSVSKLIRFIYSKLKSYSCEKTNMNSFAGFKDTFVGENEFNDKSFDLNSSCMSNESDMELKQNGNSSYEKDKMIINVEVIYNLVAVACYFIADRYNGLANVSVKALLMQWAVSCKLFTKTRYASHYIMKNKPACLSVAMTVMFEVYSALDYVITVPFVSHMVQSLIISSDDIPYSQNPTHQNVYQNTASILSRIALIDDTFHRFCSSVITLSIYSLVRKLAHYDKVVNSDDETWLRVDETNIEIKECVNLLTKTLSHFINTEILDALTQPVNVKNRNEDIFTFIIQGDAKNMDLKSIKRVSKILSN